MKKDIDEIVKILKYNALSWNKQEKTEFIKNQHLICEDLHKIYEKWNRGVSLLRGKKSTMIHTLVDSLDAERCWSIISR